MQGDIVGSVQTDQSIVCGIVCVGANEFVFILALYVEMKLFQHLGKINGGLC